MQRLHRWPTWEVPLLAFIFSFLLCARQNIHLGVTMTEAMVLTIHQETLHGEAAVTSQQSPPRRRVSRAMSCLREAP